MKRFRWNLILTKSEPERWLSLEQKNKNKNKNPPPFFGCQILVLQPNIEPTPPAFEALSVNHWTMENFLKMAPGRTRSL